MDEPIMSVIGERVALGPLRHELMPLFQRWLNDFETIRSLGDIQPPWTMEQQERWFQDEVAASDLIPFTIYEREGLRPIGTTALLGIDRRNRSAEFGIIIGEPSARGKGYGAEVTRLIRDYAFAAVGLHTLLLGVYAFNVAGIRAYEKAGYRICGRRRECYFMGGRWWDLVMMEAMSDER